MTNLEVKRIVLGVTAYPSELKKYGEEGLKSLWADIIERYAHEEYYNPDIVEELTKTAEEE